MKSGECDNDEVIPITVVHLMDATPASITPSKGLLHSTELPEETNIEVHSHANESVGDLSPSTCVIKSCS